MVPPKANRDVGGRLRPVGTPDASPGVSASNALRALGNLYGVDLAGGATTIGDASRLAAVKGGLSPNGSSPGGNLLAAYKAFLARQDRALLTPPEVPPGALSPKELEDAALRRSVKRVHRQLRKGHAPRAALASGFKRYRRHGGSGAYSTWARKVTGR